MLAILDYKAGNQTSVRRALEYLGIPCRIAATAEETHGARGLIFPGVGAARQAMDHLRDTGMDKALADAAAAGLPILGICLGCQILLDRSEENDTTTIGIVPGLCRRFEDNMVEENGTPAPIPHMGRNSRKATAPCPLLAGVAPTAEFYFVHRYYVAPAPTFMIATTNIDKEL